MKWIKMKIKYCEKGREEKTTWKQKDKNKKQNCCVVNQLQKKVEEFINRWKQN